MTARTLIERDFGGFSSSAPMVVVHSASTTAASPPFRSTLARVGATLHADARVGSVAPPRVSRDGAKADPTAMVAAADDLKGKLSATGAAGFTISLAGSSGMWSDFNAANRTAMMRSELYSWPVTLGILVLAFGTLVAAGLPLMLTILGLLASAGLLALPAPPRRSVRH